MHACHDHCIREWPPPHSMHIRMHLGRYSSSWLTHACFPAASLRHPSANGPTGGAQGLRSAAEAVPQSRPAAEAIVLECTDAGGIEANGVYYGQACVGNPPCGDAMSFVPSSRGASALHPSTGCGTVLDLDGVAPAEGMQTSSCAARRVAARTRLRAHARQHSQRQHLARSM